MFVTIVLVLIGPAQLGAVLLCVATGLVAPGWLAAELVWCAIYGGTLFYFLEG